MAGGDGGGDGGDGGDGGGGGGGGGDDDIAGGGWQVVAECSRLFSNLSQLKPSHSCTTTPIILPSSHYRCNINPL